MKLMLLRDMTISYFFSIVKYVCRFHSPIYIHLMLLSFDEIKEKDLENNSINDGNARK
jgi:hypothetical protein